MNAPATNPIGMLNNDKAWLDNWGMTREDFIALPVPTQFALRHRLTADTDPAAWIDGPLRRLCTRIAKGEPVPLHLLTIVNERQAAQFFGHSQARTGPFTNRAYWARTDRPIPAPLAARSDSRGSQFLSVLEELVLWRFDVGTFRPEGYRYRGGPRVDARQEAVDAVYAAMVTVTG